MTYKLIQDLSESRAFRTRQNLDAISQEEAQEFFYAYLLALIALAFEESTVVWAQKFASRTVAFGNFDHFRTSGTDLYMLAHKLNSANPSDITSGRLIFLLRGVARLSVDHSFIQTYLLRLERHIKVTDSRLKNIRRILPNWSTTSQSVKTNYLTYLRRVILIKNRMSEIIPSIDRALRAKRGGIGVGKAAAVIGASALAGMMLGLSYDPRNMRRFLKPIGESMTETNNDEASIFDIVDVLEMNPAVEHVISVDKIESGVVASVKSVDGKVYEFQLRELNAEKND